MGSRILFATVALVAAGALAAAWWLASGDPEGAPSGLATFDPRADEADGRAAAAELAAAGDAAPGGAPSAAEAARVGVAAPGDPALTNALWVEGRVVFPPGTPADEEAWVVARGRTFRGGDGREHRARVAPDGSFRVAFAGRTRGGRLGLEARYLFLEESVRVDLDGEEPPAPVLEPELGARIVGRVLPPADDLGADAAELAGAPVEVQGLVPAAVGFDAMPVRRVAELDDALRFELDALPADRPYSLECDPGTFPLARRRGLRPEPGRTLEADLQLARGARVAGTVLDGGGHPIEGARVRSNARRFAFTARDRRDETDSDGRFELLGVAPGRVELVIQHEGRRSAEHDLGELSAGEDRDGVVVHLQRGDALAGVVTWPDGRPVDRARVELVRIEDSGAPSSDLAHFSPFGGPDVWERTGEDGRFAFAGLEHSAYGLAARASPDTEVLGMDPDRRVELRRMHLPPWRARIERVAVGARDLRLELSEGAVLAGAVTDDLGQPVERFTIVARTVPRPGPSPARSEEIRWSFRDDDGRFRLTGLHAGAWNVVASGASHPTSPPRRLELGDAGASVSFTLLRPARVEGVVVDAAGSPVPGASVLCEPLVRNDDSDGIPASGRADDQGRFELRGVDPRGARLTAQLAGLSPSIPLDLDLAPGGERTGVQLVLQRGATLTGVVLDADGRPSVQRSVTLSCRAAEFHTTAGTDGRGRFSVSGLPPGTYDVRAEVDPAAAERLRGADGELDWGRFHRAAPGATVEVPAGGTAHVELGWTAHEVTVSGRVTLDGEPLPNTPVMMVSQEGAGFVRATTDAEGVYDIDEVRPGRYTATVHGGGGSFTTTVTVRPESEPRPDIVLSSARIEGLVLDDSGHPVAGVQVGAQDTSAPSAFASRARSRSDGAFTLRVAPGVYDIVAGGPVLHEAWSSSPVEGVAVDAGEEVDGLELRVRRAGTLSVTLTRGGERVERGVVRVLGPDGRLVHVARVRARDGDPPVARIEGLEPGTALLVGEGDDLATERPVPVQVRAGETTVVELELGPATRLHVEVVESSGRAVEGAGVTVLDDDGHQLLAAGRDAGTMLYSGSVVTTLLPPGTYRVEARHDGRTAAETVTLAGENRRTLRLVLP